MSEQTTHITLIAGPTASGKSQWALKIAARHDSVIINADSMQVYADLSILTARPSKVEMTQVPHALYGFVDGKEAFSVGNWLDHIRNLLTLPEFQQKKLIFVGGTGLYFHALAGGLASMPDIPAEIRNSWRARLAAEKAPALHGELTKRDPLMAQRLQPGDGQRIIRALEIWEATGKSLSFWQRQKSPPLIDMERVEKILLLPERSILYQQINARFDKMLAQGAREEVQALLNRQLDPQLPIMKAIGVRELAALLRGEINQNQALDLAKQESRRYAKRQLSWLRNMLTQQWSIFSAIPHNF